MESLPPTVEHKNTRLRRIGAIGGAALIIGAGFAAIYSMNRDQPAPQQAESETSQEYQLHENITATVFWAGEDADASNDYIQNRSSAWQTDWVRYYGGVDDPEKRCGYAPCDFTPKENPFYFALPFGDYTENGLRPTDQLAVIPWVGNNPVPPNTSPLKNRWIAVTSPDGSKTAYAQWEDVGPFEEYDPNYVFGTANPKEPRAGLDMSPALADYLGVEGRGKVSWRFIEADKVPEGPWKKTVTTSGPDYS